MNDLGNNTNEFLLLLLLLVVFNDVFRMIFNWKFISQFVI